MINLRVGTILPNNTQLIPEVDKCIQELKKCKKWNVTHQIARGPEISKNYSEIVDENYNHPRLVTYPYDLLLIVDSDIVFTIDDVDKLIAHDVDIVSGCYTDRTVSSYYTAGYFRQNDQIAFFQKPSPPDNLASIVKKNIIKAKTGLQVIDWAGCGFLLIKQKVLKTIGFPWFLIEFNTINNEGDIQYLGPDAYMCRKAKQHGFQVYLDTSVVVKHLGVDPD